MALCLAISLSATVALACLYSPKVYILICHPDKNVRKLTMNTVAYRCSATQRAPRQQHDRQQQTTSYEPTSTSGAHSGHQSMELLPLSTFDASAQCPSTGDGDGLLLQRDQSVQTSGRRGHMSSSSGSQSTAAEAAAAAKSSCSGCGRGREPPAQRVKPTKAVTPTTAAATPLGGAGFEVVTFVAQMDWSPPGTALKRRGKRAPPSAVDR